MLHLAAQAFMSTPVRDIRTGVELVLGKLQGSDGSRRDAEVTARRILSTPVKWRPPPGRVVSVEGETLILGMCHVDTFRGAPTRANWLVEDVKEWLHVQTLSDVVTQFAGLTLAAGARMRGRTQPAGPNSELRNQFTWNVEIDSPIQPTWILTDEKEQPYIVRSRASNVSGYTALIVDELRSNAIGDVRITHREVDPVSETVQDASWTSYGIVVDAGSLWEAGPLEKDRASRSEVTICLPPDAKVPAGSLVVAAGETWRCVGLEERLGLACLRAVRA